MVKQVLKGVCLPLCAETQALGSTGFHELRESILGLDESKTAYDTIGVDVPYTRCMFVAGLTKWAETVNKGLLDYLEKISKGECVKPLNVNYPKFSSKDYWLRGRMKSDMTTYSDIPLKLNTGQCEYASSLDLYKAYETIVCEMADNFKKVESTFDQPKLYEPLMQQMRELYADPFIEYEYAQMKERYIELTLKDYKKMQVTACIELLHSGMLNNVLSISNEEIDEVDEAKLHKMLDPRSKVPENLKELWAKFRKFMELKEDVMLVPRRDLIRIQVLKHFDELNVDHFRALFKLDKLLMLMHEDMIKKSPELAKHFRSIANDSLENTVFFAPYLGIKKMLEQDWFIRFRSDKKYDKKWADAFADGLMRSDYGQLITEVWKDKKFQIKGYIIGCLKSAGVINGLLSNDQIARESAIMDNPRSFSKNIGKNSQKQPYAQWIINHVDDYC